MIEGAPGPVKRNCSDISTIWEALSAALHLTGIDGPTAEMQVDWAKSFLNVSPKVPLEDRSVVDIDRFLFFLRENPKITPLYSEHASDALRILYWEVLKTPPTRRIRP